MSSEVPIVYCEATNNLIIDEIVKPTLAGFCEKYGNALTEFEAQIKRANKCIDLIGHNLEEEFNEQTAKHFKGEFEYKPGDDVKNHYDELVYIYLSVSSQLRLNGEYFPLDIELAYLELPKEIRDNNKKGSKIVTDFSELIPKLDYILSVIKNYSYIFNYAKGYKTDDEIRIPVK